MAKIVFLGAGSTIFARNVLGDCLCTPSLADSEINLYDIDPIRLAESESMLRVINQNVNSGRAVIRAFCGIENRRAALRGADFIVNAIQVGGYDPCTIIDFEIPRKFGLRQTIGDTTGIGGIMRALRTIPVMTDFARDIEAVCPDAWLLNYSNPMGMLTGYMLRNTAVRTVGLCHSVQVCTEHLLKSLGMDDKLEGRRELIAGINHMAWLLEIFDQSGQDLYPEIRRRAIKKNESEKHDDSVRFEYIRHLGYYCTESSEHNAEYNNFFIKSKYPELIDRFSIPLDEYPRRCVNQIANWNKMRDSLISDKSLGHERSYEYASYIMQSIVSNEPFKINGNVLNSSYLIENLPSDACVEIPCLVDGRGVHPCLTGRLPVQLAAMNMTNVNVQLLTIEAAVTHKREHIYQAALLDPHTSSELSPDDIRRMVDELIAAHGKWLPEYH